MHQRFHFQKNDTGALRHILADCGVRAEKYSDLPLDHTE